MREWLGIRRIDPAWTSVAARGFGKAAERAGLPGHVELMDVNISASCRGCGYCDIGCAFDAKLAMLDAVLPWVQRDHPGNLDVLADFHVERIAHAQGRATGVVGVTTAARRPRSPLTRSSSQPERSAPARCCCAAGWAATTSAKGCISTATHR